MQSNRWPVINGKPQNDFFASKQDCHFKTEKVYDDWDLCLKSLMSSKNLDVHEETQKTAKLFVQVDSLSKNTKSSLQKTGKTLDKLLDKKLDILASIKSFNEIEALLDLKPIVKNHWQTTTTNAVNELEQ